MENEEMANEAISQRWERGGENYRDATEGGRNWAILSRFWVEEYVRRICKQNMYISIKSYPF